MTFPRDYSADAPQPAHVRAQPGLQLLEFGTGWCGHCQAAQPLLQKVLGPFEQVPYHKVEDGKGRPLGRAFAVKLWPTVLVLRDGEEVARAVRPREREDLLPLLDALARPDA